MSTDLFASQFNHAYQTQEDESLQGHVSLVCETAADGLRVYVSEDIPQRRSARLVEKEAAGKKVTWKPRTQAPVDWETAPTSSTRATGLPLARQPLPPHSSPPSRPSDSPTPTPNRRVDRPDYGRGNDTVKFPVSFSPMPFGDLEP